MELHNEFSMFITCIDADGLFIRICGQLQGFTETQKIDRLINCIKFDLENGVAKPDLSELKIGLCCLSRFHRDNNYYRARVINLSDLHNGIVGVYFVDYGNKENVHYQDIHLINKVNSFDLVVIPAQCAEFILGEVYNPTSTWHIEFLQLLRSTLVQKVHKCRILKNIGNKQLLQITFNDINFIHFLQQIEFITFIDLSVQEYLLLNPGNVGSKLPPDQRMIYENSISPRGHVMQPQLKTSAPSLLPLTRVPQYCHLNNERMYYTPTVMPIRQPSIDTQYLNSPPPNMSLAMFQHHFNQNYATASFRAPMAQGPENVFLTNAVKGPHSLEENPVTFTSPNDLPRGSRHTVYVSAIEDGPSVFAIQLVDLENDLEDMMNEMNIINPQPLATVPHLGSVCLGRYSGDNRLYRSVVMGISKEHCKLFYVDYGNCETVSSADVFVLPQQFLRYKTYSVRFSLGGFVNIPITEEIKEAFLNIVTDQVLDMVVISPEGPPLMQYCDLYDSNGNSVKNLIFNEIRGVAPAVPQIQQAPQRRQIFYNYATINESVKKYRVVVSFPDSEKLFYVQLNNHKNELDEIMTALQAHCVQPIQFPIEELQEEIPCAALYTEDQMWYRAQIKKIDGNYITVQYVDYGNCEVVQYDSLKPLTYELITKLEAQAIACCLYGFDRSPININIANQFEMLTLDKTLNLTVKGRTPDLLMLVDLVDESIYPTVNIANRINELSNPRSKLNRNGSNSFEPEKNHISSVQSSHNSSSDSPRLHNSFSYGNDKQNTNSIVDKHSSSSLNTDIESKSNQTEYSEGWSPKSQHNNSTSYREGRQQNRERNGFKKYNRDEQNDRAQGDQRFQNENEKTASNYNKNKQNKNQRSKRGGREWDRQSEPRSSSSHASNRENWKSNNRDSGYKNRPAREPNRYNKSQDDSFNNSRTAPSKYSSYDAKIIEPDYASIDEQYKEIDLRNSTQNVIISWFINPKNFYCQLKSSQEEFVALMKDIQLAYKNRECTYLQMNVGNSVIAKFTDGVLYRATIVEHQNNKYVVEFIDYGNKATVSANEIWLVEKKFMALHKMSVICKLEDIIPNKNRAGGLKDIDTFFSKEDYECSFFDKDESNKYTVSLLLEGAPVADLLVESEYAVRPGSVPTEVINYDEVNHQLLYGQNLQVTITSVKDFSEIYIVISGTMQPLLCSLNNWVDDGSVKQLVSCSNFKHAAEGNIFIIYVDAVVEDRLLITIYDLTGEKLPLIDIEDTTLSYVSPPCPTPIIQAENHVYVSHVESIREIYVQKNIDVDTTVPDLLENLYEFYQTEGNGQILSAIVGEICAAMSLADGNWYRGRIEKVTQDGILVRYLDYGNSEILPAENIKELDRKFHLTYEIAFPISLDIYSTISHENMLKCLTPMILDKYFTINLTYGEYGWTSDLANEHGSVTNKLLELKFAVSKDNISGGSVVVVEDNLQSAEVEKNIPPEDKIIAEQNIAVLNPPTKKHDTETSISRESFMTDRNDTEQNVSIVKEIINEHNVSTEEKIIANLNAAIEEIHTEHNVAEQGKKLLTSEQNFSNDKDIIGEHHISTEEQIIEEYNISSEGVDIVKDLQAEESIDNRIDIILAHIDSPEQFWVQLSSDFDELGKLQDRLQEIAEGLCNVSNCNIGEVCAAKYSADENWYRAIILDVDPDIITVRFIDYGNTDVLTNGLNNIKELDEELKTLQPFAKKCSLLVSSITEDWNEEACSEFEKFTMGPLQIEIIHELHNILYVNLYLENEDICDKLITQNLGVHKSNLDISTDNDISRRNCYVSHINSLSDFYIQFESDRSDLEKIEELFIDAENFPALETVTENLICIAKYVEDELWYRACITKILPDSFEVRFIDYGNTAITTELREVPQKIQNLRLLAQHCMLNKPEDAEWNELSETKFAQISADGASTLQVEIIDFNSPYTVNLYLNSENNIISDLIAMSETDTITVKNLSDMSDRLSPVGEINSANAVVSHINSLNDFWMQNEISNSDLESMAESLESASSFPEIKEISAGVKCVAVFPDDGLYYRAKILSILNDKKEVLYFDYGNTAVTNDLRVLPDNLAEVPQLAKNCALKIPNKHDKWNDLCTEKFMEISAHGVTTFQVEIVENDSPCIVKLFLNGKNIDNEFLNLLQINDSESDIKPTCKENDDRVVPENETESPSLPEDLIDQENCSILVSCDKNNSVLENSDENSSLLVNSNENCILVPNCDENTSLLANCEKKKSFCDEKNTNSVLSVNTTVESDKFVLEVSTKHPSIPKLMNNEKLIIPCDTDQISDLTENAKMNK